MVLLDIKKIVEKGGNFERTFFQWLSVNKIQWCVSGSDLNYITLFHECDVDVVKKYWVELDEITL